MIATTELRELAGVDARDECLLSVRLDLDPARHTERSYLVAFTDLVKHAEAGLSEAQDRALQREAARVRQFLAVMIDPATVGGEQKLTVEYDEPNMEIALLRWLNDSPTARKRRCGETGMSGRS